MATTVYRVRLECPGGVMIRDSYTLSDWNTKYADSAVFAIKGDDGNYHDVSEWIAELNIIHNELDSEKSGRDTEKGTMSRTLIATKHTLQVKILDGVPQSIARYIFSLIDSDGGDNGKKKVKFNVRYFWPCGGKISEQTFYCSTVNFGAQRYRREDNSCYYTGMNFNIIQW